MAVASSLYANAPPSLLLRSLLDYCCCPYPVFDIYIYIYMFFWPFNLFIYVLSFGCRGTLYHVNLKLEMDAPLSSQLKLPLRLIDFIDFLRFFFFIDKCDFSFNPWYCISNFCLIQYINVYSLWTFLNNRSTSLWDPNVLHNSWR